MIYNKTKFQRVENTKFYFLLPVSHDGGANGAHQANADSDLAMLGEGSTQAKGLLHSLHKRKALHRDNSNFLGSRPEAMQFIVSLYDSGDSQVTVLLPEPRMNACKQLTLCTGPLRGFLDF